jgi:hypothetical protein
LALYKKKKEEQIQEQIKVKPKEDKSDQPINNVESIIPKQEIHNDLPDNIPLLKPKLVLGNDEIQNVDIKKPILQINSGDDVPDVDDSDIKYEKENKPLETNNYNSKNLPTGIPLKPIISLGDDKNVESVPTPHDKTILSNNSANENIKGNISNGKKSLIEMMKDKIKISKKDKDSEEDFKPPR